MAGPPRPSVAVELQAVVAQEAQFQHHRRRGLGAKIGGGNPGWCTQRSRTVRTSTPNRSAMSAVVSLSLMSPLSPFSSRSYKIVFAFSRHSAYIITHALHVAALNGRDGMISTINITSKTGKQVIITNTGRSIEASIPAMGLNLGSMDLLENSIKARFPADVGQGQVARVELAMSAADFAQVREMFAEMQANVSKRMAEAASYQARHDFIDRAR